MSVLKRHMFNRGGYVARGTGITSGLASPIKGYAKGGITKKEAYTPAFMNLFGAMMSGKSLQGGLSGALDILGQAAQSSAPLFAQAQATLASQDTDRPTGKDANGFLRYLDTGEFVFPGTVKTEQTKIKGGEALTTTTTTQEGEVTTKVNIREVKATPEQRNYILKPNDRLISSVDNSIIAEGKDNVSTTLTKLKPGEKLYDSDGNMIAHYADPNAGTIILGPGEVAYDKDNNIIAQVPPNAKNQQIIKLGAGQTAFDIEGNEIASVPAAESDDPIIKLNPGQIAYDKDGNVLFSAPANEKDAKIIKLNPGQQAFQMVNGKLEPLASVPLKESDRIVTVGPGQVLFDKDTNEIVFENPSTVPVQRLSKLSPGQSLVDREGKVVYTAPDKNEYFKLSPGQIVYGLDGSIIAQAPSVEDDQASYGYKELTENEMAFKKIKNYEKQMDLKENGEFDTSDLTDFERRDYFRLLQTYDPEAKLELKTWNEWKSDLIKEIGPNLEYTEMLNMARAIFESNPATGPVRGRLAPLFAVMQDLTGIGFSEIINNLTGDGAEALLIPKNLEEITRIKSQMAIMGQKFMKGQVNQFEQELILKSLFDTTKSAEGNEIAFENLLYLAKLKKAIIQTANKVSNESDFYMEMEEWKKRNRPEYLRDALNEIGFSEGNNLTDIEEEYGIDLSGITP